MSFQVVREDTLNWCATVRWCHFLDGFGNLIYRNQNILMYWFHPLWAIYRQLGYPYRQPIWHQPYDHRQPQCLPRWCAQRERWTHQRGHRGCYVIHIIMVHFEYISFSEQRRLRLEWTVMTTHAIRGQACWEWDTLLNTLLIVDFEELYIHESSIPRHSIPRHQKHILQQYWRQQYISS